MQMCTRVQAQLSSHRFLEYLLCLSLLLKITIPRHSIQGLLEKVTEAVWKKVSSESLCKYAYSVCLSSIFIFFEFLIPLNHIYRVQTVRI